MKIILVIDLNLLYNDAYPKSPNLQAATKNNPPTPHPQLQDRIKEIDLPPHKKLVSSDVTKAISNIIYICFH